MVEAGKIHRRGAKRAAIAALAAFVLGCLALELGLRFLLFSDTALARRWGTSWREPWRYADRWSDEDYWKLLQRFRGDPGPLLPVYFHPELGWISSQFTRNTYQHYLFEHLRGRRPVLLYGDSFAQCNTTAADCFEGLLERSDLRERYALLNYGVRAYGLDQIYLLLERSLDALEALRPVVVIGVCVDDVFDRSVLDFRGWPKPRLALVGGDLVATVACVPSLDDYLASHPLRIRSYAWRALLHGTSLVPKPLRNRWNGEDGARAEKEALNGRILAEIARILEQKGLEYFFLLFHGQPNLTAMGPVDWREAFALDFLKRGRIPFVSSKPFLYEDAYLHARDFGQYFGKLGAQRDHLNPMANEVVFRALRAGLEGRYERTEPARPLDPAEFLGESVRGGQVLVCHGSGLRAPFDRQDEAERLCLRVREGGPTEIAYELGGRCRGFKAVARMLELERFGTVCGNVKMTVRVDGRAVWEKTLRRPGPGQPMQVDLAGAERMTIEVSDAGDGFECDWVYLASPRFI